MPALNALLVTARPALELLRGSRTWTILREVSSGPRLMTRPGSLGAGRGRGSSGERAYLIIESTLAVERKTRVPPFVPERYVFTA